MVRRRDGLVEELIALTADMPWQLGIAVAATSFVLLHLYIHRLGLIGQALELILPLCLLAGAGLSAWRRHQAVNLLEDARVGEFDSIRSMTWSQFERLVGEAFRRQGYEVQENLLGGPDGGVDLVLTKQGGISLVQCKHWRSWSVGVKIVRELKGVMTVRGATEGFVVTSGKFTREAAQFALKAGIELMDADELLSMVRSSDRSSQNQNISMMPIVPTSRAPGCPKCGSQMKMRTAKRGRTIGSEFWGCETYPRCRGTRAIANSGTGEVSP